MSKTVTDYLVALPADRQAEVKKIHAFIRQYAPDLEPYVDGKFLGYGMYHYRYKSGREGDWFTIGIALNKKTIGVYFMAMDDGRYLLEKYEDQLPQKTGKTCLNFKSTDDIDWDLLKKLITESAQRY